MCFYSPQLLSCFYEEAPCRSTECVLELDDRAFSSNPDTYDTYICCCNKNFCNSNVIFPNTTVNNNNSVTPVITEGLNSTTGPPDVISEGQIAIIVAVCAVVLAVGAGILVVAVVCLCCCRSPPTSQVALYQDTSESTEHKPLIEIGEKIGEGRFAEVFKASMDGKQVAVKVMHMIYSSQ